MEFELNYYYDLRRMNWKNDKKDDILIHCNNAGHELVDSQFDFTESSSISLNVFFVYFVKT